MASEGQDSLSALYEIIDWADNPWSPQGRKRYHAALDDLRRLLDHPWLRGLTGKAGLGYWMSSLVGVLVE